MDQKLQRWLRWSATVKICERSKRWIKVLAFPNSLTTFKKKVELIEKKSGFDLEREDGEINPLL